MPDIVVHNAMGTEVLIRLPIEITAAINHEIFRFAVMGPDPYFCYRFFLPSRFRKGVYRRGGLMHNKKVNMFLMELARRSQSREMFSFLAGFLCHFALDSKTHPYIDSMAAYRDDMHCAIERTLDVMELERSGRERKDIMKLFTKYPVLPEAEQAMETVYGWRDHCFRTGYQDMKIYHWFVKDQSGLLIRILGLLKDQLTVVSYRNHKCDNMDLSGFQHFVDEAVDFGVELIQAAFQYRQGKLSDDEFLKAIGTRNYSGTLYE